MPLDAKRKFADYVIDTSGTKQDSARRVDEVYQKLREESRLPKAAG
jgi:dephospho-CoA kinase